jgi:hypothetical protein
MPDLVFPAAVFALAAATLATRIAVSRARFDGLPPMPREQ